MGQSNTHPWAIIREVAEFDLDKFKDEEDFQTIKTAIEELDAEVAAGVDRSLYYCSEHSPEDADPIICYVCSAQARYVHHTVVNGEDHS